MRLHIRHLTRYRYTAPTPYGLQQLRLWPRSGPGQTIEAWSTEVVGGREEARFSDQYGNAVTLVSLEPGRSEIDVTSDGVVDTHDLAGVVGAHEGPAPLWCFKRASPLTRTGPQLEALIAALPAEADGLAQLHALARHVGTRLTYDAGRTTAATTAEDACAAGHGVCQDHAHVFVAAARRLGHPARYVSGYLLMPDRVEQDAGHAWAEAHVEGLGWVGFDVSNGICPDDRYVRIAYGLDAADAAPISGIMLGRGAEVMEVALQVQQ